MTKENNPLGTMADAWAEFCRNLQRNPLFLMDEIDASNPKAVKFFIEFLGKSIGQENAGASELVRAEALLQEGKTELATVMAMKAWAVFQDAQIKHALKFLESKRGPSELYRTIEYLLEPGDSNKALMRKIYDETGTGGTIQDVAEDDDAELWVYWQTNDGREKKTSAKTVFNMAAEIRKKQSK